MDDTRLMYEDLLRKIYDSKRDPSRFINADCYDTLCRNQIRYNARRTGLKEDAVVAAAIEYGISIGKISTILCLAIVEYIEKHQEALSPAQLEELDEMRSQLQVLAWSDNDFCEIIEQVNEIVEQASRIII
jgi:succinate dehydrogenase flavin-adding protein (antitoxin of CptAB toxin-antitoxin module)